MYEESWNDLMKNNNELHYIQVYNKWDTLLNKTAPYLNTTKDAEITVIL